MIAKTLAMTSREGLLEDRPLTEDGLPPAGPGRGLTEHGLPLAGPGRGLVTDHRPGPRAGGQVVAPQVDIVVPVRDEERDLGPSVRRLDAYLRTQFPFTARITIADNGSTDSTWAIASALAGELDSVRAVRLEQPGRGRALRSIWSASDADVLAYMDVDLSTDLNALLPLVAPLLSGHSDVAIGTRLARGARVVRGPKREFISRGYNLLLRATLGARFSDAQCGFKAISRSRARELLPLTSDTGWFFDTELLILAQQAGLRIHEVPVDWIDDADSRVKVVPTILADLRGIARLGFGLLRGSISVPFLGGQLRGAAPGAGGAIRSGSSSAPGYSAPSELAAPLGSRSLLGRHAVRFAVVGAVSTVAYVLLYLALRTTMPALWANALSLLITAVANTAANRRFTFGIRGRSRAAQDHARGLLAYGTGLLVTSAALGWLHAAAPRAGRTAEVAVLVAASLLATLARFVLYRNWVFRAKPRGLQG
jgi:putative flippase GtrA